MIAEKIDCLKVDIDRLRAHLLEKVLPFADPIMQSEIFGGWSILSATGKYDDGWQLGHTCYREEEGKLVFDREIAQAIGLKPTSDHKNPTEICTGYLQEVMQEIEKLGFRPRRARITVLHPGGDTDWHYDCAPETYAVRLHIPIITNPECQFLTADEGGMHLPADGSAYLLRVNRLHQAINHGHEKRYHIITDVWDTRQISQYHRYVMPRPVSQ